MKYVFLFWIRGAESIITVGGESLGEVVFFFFWITLKVGGYWRVCLKRRICLLLSLWKHFNDCFSHISPSPRLNFYWSPRLKIKEAGHLSLVQSLREQFLLCLFVSPPAGYWKVIWFGVCDRWVTSCSTCAATEKIWKGTTVFRALSQYVVLLMILAILKQFLIHQTSSPSSDISTLMLK